MYDKKKYSKVYLIRLHLRLKLVMMAQKIKTTNTQRSFLQHHLIAIPSAFADRP